MQLILTNLMGTAAWLSNILTVSNLFKRNQSDKKVRATFSVKKTPILRLLTNLTGGLFKAY